MASTVAAAANLLTPAARVAGMAVLAALVAGAVALVYRWYTRERVPAHVALLFGLGAVALYLNVKTALGQVIAGETGLLALDAVAFNAAALALATAATPVGREVGDRVATDVFTFTGVAELETDVSRVVKAVGRVTTVTIPDDVDDMEDHDPVAPSVKEALAGTTYLFAGRHAGEDLRERLVGRVKEDHGVGYVDVEFDDAGEVSYVALGARQAGVGPTLAPGTAAVAVVADPPRNASAGDLVQVWSVPDDGADGADGAGAPARVATAELRSVAPDGDVVTLAVDAGDAQRIAGGRYRLLTLPTEPLPEREFASLLRAAEETMAAVTVRANSDLDGATVGSVEATVTAVRPADGTVQAIPARARELAAGDTLFVVARPDAIRRLEALAGGPDDRND